MPEPFLIGYARVSTDDQDLTLQVAALERAGVPRDQIVVEKASGKNMRRKELARLLKSLRSGDRLIVWKLDRLGRTLTGVLEVLERIQAMGVEFVSITEAFDTSTPMGKAMLQVALVFAELERNMISERTKAGMAAARAAGKKFGRRHTIIESKRRTNLVRRLDQAGQLRDEDGELLMSARELMDRLNKADSKAEQIKNPETVRRWKRAGFPGLDGEIEEIPLDDEDETEPE